MERVPNILYFSALIVEIILSLFDTQPNFIALFAVNFHDHVESIDNNLSSGLSPTKYFGKTPLVCN